jgi:hypothetical protein
MSVMSDAGLLRAHDPIGEATTWLADHQVARVLEPSPPAIDDGDQFADDPAVRGEAAGQVVVGPTPDADVQWAELAAGNPALAEWCSGRWLGPWLNLTPFPASLATTRQSLQSLACYVLSPARKSVTGRIGLRYTRGGFGTPFFGQDRQLRIVGDALVIQDGGNATPVSVSTVREAARASGVALQSDPGVGRDIPALEPDRPLDLDAAASLALGDWYGFGASVLETVRAQLRQRGDVSRVQLWPEHMDIALSFEPGEGRAANLGLSPGDAGHPDPYVYLGPWDMSGLRDPFWNASFGAVLDSGTILDAGDQRWAALDFFAEGLRRLN